MMTNYAHEMMIKAYEAKVHQQLIDSSKNLGANVQKTETGNVPLQQGVQEAVESGRTQGAIDTTLPSTTQIGPQEQRPAMLTAPKPPADLTAPSGQVAAEAVTQARPVSSTELSSAAAAADVGESPDVKSMIETRKTSEGLESKVQTAAMERASKEKIANQGNETKILIAAMKDKYQKEMLELHRRALGLQFMKNSEQKKAEYLKLKQGYQSLLLKAQSEKTSLADPMKVGLSPTEQTTYQSDLDTMISGMTDDITALDETAQKTDEPYKEVKKKGAKDKFITGKMYKDASGKTAKYLGNGKWQE
jgi:hypothetical protein